MIRFGELWPLFLLLIPLGLIIWQWQNLRKITLTDRISFLLRLAAVGLVFLALSGPQLLSWAEAHYVYFLTDLSKSVDVAQDQDQLAGWLRALAKPQADTQYGLITFGKEPYVELPFSPTLELNEFLTDLDAEGSDINAALDLALATFPKEGKKTIVLLSDGQQSQGDVAEGLARAKREGVQIFTLPMAPPSTEFSIQALQIPQEVAIELPFSFQSVIYATRPSQGKLLIYRNESLIATKDVVLRAGLNFISHNDTLESPGVWEYRAELIVQNDALSENNHYRALTQAVGDPRILLVEGAATTDESHIEKLLKNAGYAFSKATLQSLAPTASSLLGYRAVILNDVPLKDLTMRQINHLDDYVSDLGGGLFVIQGRKAVEDFYDREFERILPVSYEGPEELQRPALALVMVLDRSGSMGETAGQFLKIDLLKQAAREAVSKIDPNSLVGIIGFDSIYEWLVDLQKVEGRQNEITSAIDKLFANGGTDVYQALKDAVAKLKQQTARVKHILVFSDGKVSKEGRDFQRLFEDISESTISASSIAIGEQADFEFLWELADAGSGAKYPVGDARDLPRITLEEMVRLEKARWVKGPLDVEPGPFAYELQSIEPESVPDVDGYVLTFEKPTSQTLLRVHAEAEHRDPLVSRWRYGLGEVFVLNTSFEGEGLERWKEWGDLGKLSADILSHVYSDSTLQPKELTVWTELEDSKLKINIEAERDGRWLDQLPISGHLNAPTGETIPLTIEQTAPGAYEAQISDLEEGVYLFNVGEESIGQVKEALHIPYAEEYKKIGLNDQLLQHMADTTGGQYLENPNSLQEFLKGQALIYHDIWQEILLAALLLFLADLIMRKLPTRAA